MKQVLFSSLILASLGFTNCTTNQVNTDKLSSIETNGNDSLAAITTEKIPAYVFSHHNPHGDYIPGTWIRLNITP